MKNLKLIKLNFYLFAFTLLTLIALLGFNGCKTIPAEYQQSLNSLAFTTAKLNVGTIIKVPERCEAAFNLYPPLQAYVAFLKKDMYPTVKDVSSVSYKDLADSLIFGFEDGLKFKVEECAALKELKEEEEFNKREQ